MAIYVIAFWSTFWYQGVECTVLTHSNMCWKSIPDLLIRFVKILMWALGLNTPDCTTSCLSLDLSTEGEVGAGGASDLVSEDFWRRFPGNWRPRF